jgi:hypothetical protein
MGGIGSDIAVEAADAVLVSDDIQRIPKILKGKAFFNIVIIMKKDNCGLRRDSRWFQEDQYFSIYNGILVFLLSYSFNIRIKLPLNRVTKYMV